MVVNRNFFTSGKKQHTLFLINRKKYVSRCNRDDNYYFYGLFEFVNKMSSLLPSETFLQGHAQSGEQQYGGVQVPQEE